MFTALLSCSATKGNLSCKQNAAGRIVIYRTRIRRKSGKEKLIPDEDFESLKEKLLTLMKDEKPYLEGDLNLLKLSELIGISTHQLSYLLNNGFNENFFQFVNKYRVAHAKELLLSDSYYKMSVLGIAFESGFNSKQPSIRCSKDNGNNTF